MGTRFFKRKPKRGGKASSRRKGGIPDLEITNESQVPDGDGVSRESYVLLKRDDDHQEKDIELALAIKSGQKVKSLQFHRSFQWGEMVGNYDCADVASAAERVNHLPGYEWVGFAIPANEFPRPFYGTAVKFKLKKADKGQTIPWMVCYAPHHFTNGWISGESHLKRRGRRKP